MVEQGNESKGKETQHRNDMYGNIDARGENDEGVSATIPAATVVLLRDGSEGVEVLMLRKKFEDHLWRYVGVSWRQT
jgi:hypothetical protein